MSAFFSLNSSFVLKYCTSYKSELEWYVFLAMPYFISNIENEKKMFF